MRADTLPLVLKFGGSSFADLEGYPRVARHVALRAAGGRPVVVVVSAMSGTTGRLLHTLEQIAEAPPDRTAAMLLTTGETVSVALLAAALAAEGVPARPLAAAETGLLAAGPADRAELERAGAGPVRAALAECPVVVLPGGQGVDAAGRVVMLGRNSSDLSAVAVAGALGAPVCELFSDVPGVCTADPFLVPGARVLPRIGYGGVRRMSRYGAKVVHERAVEWAERTGVRLHCRPFPPDGPGTEVGPGPGAAAVVTHTHGEVRRFDGPGPRGAAADRLAAEGLESVAVDDGGAALLVVPGGVRGARALLGAGRHLAHLRLLTTLHEDGRAEPVLVEQAALAAEARRRHALLYPAGDDRLAVPRAKARSAHSDLLVSGASHPDPDPRTPGGLEPARPAFADDVSLGGSPRITARGTAGTSPPGP